MASYADSGSACISNMIGTCWAEGERGLLEIQTRPWNWEALCNELGETRPVTLTYAEEKAALCTAVAGQAIRVYAVQFERDCCFDYRYRMVLK